MDTKSLLYLNDSYLREWDAEVKSALRKDEKSQFITLDRTAFYPQSGGQSWDEGTIERLSDGKQFKVIFVGKFSGNVSHEIKASVGEDLKIGDKVKCVLDWERRYKLMKAHSAAHIISAVINREAGVLISGNQLEPDRCRIDFSCDEFDREKLTAYEVMSNEEVKKGIEIKTEFRNREDVIRDPSMTKLAKGIDALPKDVKELRILMIGDLDIQADGGTHVKNTNEIGKIKFIEFVNKGKNNRRIYYVLE